MKNELGVFNKIYANSNLLYPIDMVSNFLEKRYSKLEYSVRSQLKAIDIGFGPGNNLKALLDYGFLTYGIDYSEICAKQVKEKCKNYNNMVDIIAGNIIDTDLNNTFDIILCTGTIFLNPIDEIKTILKILYNLLDTSRGFGNLFINFYLGDEDIFCSSPLFDHQFSVQFLKFATMKKLLEDANFNIENIEYTYYMKNNCNHEYKRYWFEIGK